MLFGRFRSVIQGLAGNESMNAKTATAVIGVKGTENLASIRPRGDTMLVGVESVTTIQNPAAPKKRAEGNGSRITRGGSQGDFVLAANRNESPDFILIPTTDEPLHVTQVQDGGENPVPPGNLGLTIGDGDPITGEAPDEVLDELQDLNSPDPNDPGASNFPGQQGLVRTGLTTQEDLDEGENDEVEGGEGGDGEGGGGGGGPETPSVDEPDLDDATQNLFRGDVQLQFQQ
jgi:hypothetical protein